MPEAVSDMTACTPETLRLLRNRFSEGSEGLCALGDLRVVGRSLLSATIRDIDISKASS